ncbi:5475_t:CDS:2, partial [Dentiscutata heterogama]
TYQSNYIVGPNITMNQQYLAFNRSQGPGNAGINMGTPFLDASHIYGVTDAQTSLIRDTGNRGKMRLITSSETEDGKLGYPPKDANGEYIFGYGILRLKEGMFLQVNKLMHLKNYSSSSSYAYVFVDLFFVIFLREHNRRCNELYAIHGNSWNDETYFQEARRWTSMRYGHSEVSDNYAIVDDKGHFITTLQLNSLQQPHLLELYGIPNLVVSIALQMQEEVDIYICDQMRYYLYKAELMDVASLDCIRGRDHGIARYNDARQYFGLARAQDWSDISSDPVVQSRLRNVYGTVDQVESFVGGLAEDHIPGSNLGPLFYHSYVNQ